MKRNIDLSRLTKEELLSLIEVALNWRSSKWAVDDVNGRQRRVFRDIKEWDCLESYLESELAKHDQGPFPRENDVEVLHWVGNAVDDTLRKCTLFNIPGRRTRTEAFRHGDPYGGAFQGESVVKPGYNDFKVLNLDSRVKASGEAGNGYWVEVDNTLRWGPIPSLGAGDNVKWLMNVWEILSICDYGSTLRFYLEKVPGTEWEG